MRDTITRVSDQAVKKVTGKTWNQWLDFLDQKGAPKMIHKDIARLLYDKGYIKSLWWVQMVTVGYEYARNMRTTGQTETAGFEIGVQKTLPISQKQAWDLLASNEGLRIWLGDINRIRFEKGYTYKTRDGAIGQIRTLEKGKKLRLTWHPKVLKNSSTVQIYLTCQRNTPSKTNIRFHQEKLASVKEREQMRQHWQKVLEKLEELSLRY